VAPGVSSLVHGAPLTKTNGKISKIHAKEVPVAKKLTSIHLIEGKCAVCRGEIDPQWSSSPSLGTVCRDCTYQKDRPEVFGPKNIKFVVEKTVEYDPLLGVYNYHFEWRGSKVRINGRVGTINSWQGDGSWVKFRGDEGWLGTFVRGLGYWDLLRIYRQTAGEEAVTPPPLRFPVHHPVKAELLPEPIIPIMVMVRDGQLRAVKLGGEYGEGTQEIAYLNSLHAFCNLYVRCKFGLAPNFAYEGGFLGRGFEVRNMHSTSSVGLSIDTSGIEGDIRSAQTVEELLALSSGQDLLAAIYDREQNRSEVVKKDATLEEVIGTWVVIMMTFLRYDWRQQSAGTVEEISQAFCKMQDVLLNILTPEELAEALSFMPDGKMTHVGSAY
jgi:hypothetical protein